MKTIMRGYAVFDKKGKIESGGTLVFHFDKGKAYGLDLYREWEAKGWMPLEPGKEIPWPECAPEKPWDKKTMPILHVEGDFVGDTEMLQCPVCGHTWSLGPDI